MLAQKGKEKAQLVFGIQFTRTGWPKCNIDLKYRFIHLAMGGHTKTYSGHRGHVYSL